MSHILFIYFFKSLSIYLPHIYTGVSQILEPENAPRADSIDRGLIVDFAQAAQEFAAREQAMDRPLRCSSAVPWGFSVRVLPKKSRDPSASDQVVLFQELPPDTEIRRDPGPIMSHVKNCRQI